jgi:hypothetical protein
MPDHFGFANFDIPTGFNLPTTTSDFSTSMPANIDLGSTGISAPGTVEGTMGNPQIMRWDDNELSFGMDMDLDNLDMNELMLGTTSNAN